MASAPMRSTRGEGLLHARQRGRVDNPAPTDALAMDRRVPGPRSPSRCRSPSSCSAHTHVDDLVVGCSLLAPRSMPLFVAMRVVADRVFSTLRLERALCYSVFSDDDRVGAADSLFLAGCDIAEGHEAEAVHAFVGVLEAVAGGEITAGEVERACAASMPWGSWDPSRPAAEAMRKAIGDLLGHAPATWADLEAQAAGLDTTAVASAFGHALGSGLLVVPGGEEDVSAVRRRTRHPERPADERHGLRAMGRQHGRRGRPRVRGREQGDRLAGRLLRVFDECVLAAFVSTGTIWLVDATARA